jgi:hypothetical protein
VTCVTSLYAPQPRRGSLAQLAARAELPNILPTGRPLQWRHGGPQSLVRDFGRPLRPSKREAVAPDPVHDEAKRHIRFCLSHA